MHDSAASAPLIEPPSASGQDPKPEPNTAPPRLAVVLGAVGRTMIIAGIIVLLFVVFQLWGTDIQEARAQGSLRDQLADRFTAATDVLEEFTTGVDDVDVAESDPEEIEPTELPGPEATIAPTSTAAPDLDPDVLALYFPEDGDALAKIEIPSIDVDKVVVRGVAVADLRKGPGHYSQTVLPGNAGNSGIAGHRTTYGSPFNRIDELQAGDEIVVTSVQGEFTYRVMDPVVAFADELTQVDSVGGGHVIVHPSSSWVLEDFGDDRLTLTACHPKLSSRQRIIVAAELVVPPAELPDWVVLAEAARIAAATATESDAGQTVTGTDAADPEPTPEGETTAQPTPVAEPDLDEGLNGDRDAIPGAALWMLAAVVLWYGSGRLGRRLGRKRSHRLLMRFAGLVPAAVCLWLSFEMIDRALPAG